MARILLGRSMNSHSIYDRVMAALAGGAVDPPPFAVDWSVAGELDSPIPPSKLAVVRNRKPLLLEALLEHELRPGQVILLSDEGPKGWIEDLVAWRAALHQQRGEPAPIWLRGWAINLAIEPNVTLTNYLRDLAGTLPDSPHIILLERPDLAFDGKGLVDGMILRQVLRHWAATFLMDSIIAIVGPECFAFHDPYPGWIKARPLREPGSMPSRKAPKIQDLAAYHPKKAVPSHLVREVTAMARTGSAQGFTALYRLLASEPAAHAIDDTLLGAMDDLDADKLREWLRALITGDGAAMAPADACSPRGNALAAARIYCLLHARDAPGPRTNLAGCDVGRWFCYLRSFSHEMLAVVARRLERENLSGINLMHTPPLAFACLRNANLCSSDLYRIDLSFADLRDANLAGADLSRSHLKGADLRAADLRGADLSYSSIELADLRGAQTDGANLFRCHSDDCRWE